MHIINTLFGSLLCWALTSTLVVAYGPASFLDSLIVVDSPSTRVLYIGLENKVKVTLPGAPSGELAVEAFNCRIIRREGPYVRILCTRKGEAVLAVSDPKTGRRTELRYRVKYVPDPEIQLDGRMEGYIGPETMKAQLGLRCAYPDDELLKGRCRVVGYTLYYTPKNGRPIELKGVGARFTGEIRRCIDAAQYGDSYTFVEIRARCPGDGHHRINGLRFTVR